MEIIGAPTIHLRSEIELLLCCARTRIDSERASQIQVLLTEHLDWTYLCQVASQHRLTSLLYWNLNALYPDAIPKVSLERLRSYFHRITGRTLLLTLELCKILDLFDSRGISAIPYKGPTLAVSAYGNLALRYFDDLDILIHPRDILQIKNVLVSQGYQPQFPLDSIKEATFFHPRFEHTFARREGPFMIDVHWATVPLYLSFSQDLEHLSNYLEPVMLEGKTILTFSPEDLLLILCTHNSKHGWERLSWICDIAELISAHQKIDWNRVLEQAVTLNGTRMLLLGLFLANRLLGVTLPEEISLRVRTDPLVKSLAEQVCKRLFQYTPIQSGMLETNLFYLRAMESLKDRMQYCFDLVMTPTVLERSLLPLPGPLFPFYYLLRPIRLLGKYGLKVFRRSD
jgi:hypothetical protein